MHTPRPFALLLLTLLWACSTAEKSDGADDGSADGAADGGDGADGAGDDGSGGDDGKDDSGDGGTGDGGDGGTAVGCRATPPDPDRDRVVIVALPYADDGSPANQWAIWRLGRDGSLTDTGERLTAGRATAGRVHFTPDGSLALAAQSDGTVVVFGIDEDGVVRVIDEGWDDDIYAGTLSVHPSGERAWLVNESWPESGGGAFAVDIDCETGALTRSDETFVTKNANAMVHIAPDRALVAGRLVAGGPAADELSLVQLTDRTALTSTDPFGDDDAIVSDLAALPANGGLLAVLADNNLFSSASNRLGPVTLRGDEMIPGAPVPVEDPVSVAASPFGDAILVSSGYGDSAFVFRVTDDDDAPLEAAGSPTWVGRGPSLPADAVVVRGGPSDGLVLLVEVEGLRRLRFVGDGEVVDLGLTSFGGGIDQIPGAIGVQP
ncbi:MAG: hypothetical protein JNM72_19475 [Deltaproteobacteria bacterium]|nr:hypothetical protein [Deltaproteobacteria bacterium]